MSADQHRRRTKYRAIHQKGVPGRVQRHHSSADPDEYRISAFVAISRDGVQRLVNIADQVREEHQCHGSGSVGHSIAAELLRKEVDS